MQPLFQSTLISMMLFFTLIFLFFTSTSSSLFSPEDIVNARKEFGNYTAISDFRLINRRSLIDCPDINPNLAITTSKTSGLSDDEMVIVTVSGVLLPDESDWVAMISPSHADVSYCPLVTLLYKETGDVRTLPLLCHYPVKAQYMSNDPNYLGCKSNACTRTKRNGLCDTETCSGSISFHVVNIRTDIEFVFFTGGFDIPCLLKSSEALSFTNPMAPLYGHLSSIDSSGSSMKLTWVSGDQQPQQVQYGSGNSQTSEVTTFTQKDMCSNGIVKSPAVDFGWHDPGYIHSAVMTGLQPSSSYDYKYGSDTVGWSDKIQFRTPPSGGSNELKFLVYGDMGKTPRDQSIEHYIQPGALSVITAMAEEITSGNVDSVFHIGDISYATGFLVEWDYFLHLITPVASHVSYMTAIGNHERAQEQSHVILGAVVMVMRVAEGGVWLLEKKGNLGKSKIILAASGGWDGKRGVDTQPLNLYRDFPGTGSKYILADSGGECGVAYEAYFPMPTSGKDKPWYSIEQGPVHFTIMSSEHDWTESSEQYDWMVKDLGSVDRSRTPWVVFTGHRPLYTSSIPDQDLVAAVEPLLFENKVDLALWGHVHNYERTCAVYQSVCKAMPTKGDDGVDTYYSANYSAPVHVVVGMAGFTLDQFSGDADSWSLSRVAQFGYARVHATKQDMTLELVNADKRKIEDSIRITRTPQ